MTVPVVLGISLFSGHVLELGLETRDIVMLVLTLFTSVITLATGRTTLLQGAVHLILFAAYIMSSRFFIFVLVKISASGILGVISDTFLISFNFKN